MVTETKGDIFHIRELTHIVHQANLYHTFGSGIAYAIKQKYPEAYNADLNTSYGSLSKLGSYSAAQTKYGPCIINLYSQVGISSKERTTDYYHLERGLWRVRLWLREQPNPTLGIPYRIGCGLAGGTWEIVENSIHRVFEQAPFDVLICRRPND
jgi:O-acetyl-ADP-ribose deacetylase (regulator of RNase III)